MVLLDTSLRECAVVGPGLFIGETSGTNAIPIDIMECIESIRLEEEVDEMDDGE